MNVLITLKGLAKKKDFEAVFRGGKSYKNNFLAGKILRNGLNNHRFGFVVSKKVSNKAVVRNKIKRRLKSAFLYALRERSGASLSEKNFSDVVIVALSGIEGGSFEEIRAAAQDFFKKIK